MRQLQTALLIERRWIMEKMAHSERQEDGQRENLMG